MSDHPIVPHFRSTDLVQPLKEQPDSVHFKGTFQLRRFKSNPDLVALKAVEQNRFDRIPSPPVCGPEVMLMHRRLQEINPRNKRVEKTRLYVRPSSLEGCQSNVKKSKPAEEISDTEEIGQLCQGFSKQTSLMK